MSLDTNWARHGVQISSYPQEIQLKNRKKSHQTMATTEKSSCTCSYIIVTFYTLQELQSEMEKHKAHLKQLKDYNEKLLEERRDRAIKEKEMQRILVKMHALLRLGI